MANQHWHGVPEGTFNLLPRAGDIVVMSECLSRKPRSSLCVFLVFFSLRDIVCCTDGVLPWRATDKGRYCLSLRYKCGEGGMNMVAINQHGGDSDVGWHWPAEVLERVSPATRAMMSCDCEALWGLPRVAVEEQRQDACVHPRL